VNEETPDPFEEQPIRQFLEAVLSPQDLAQLDELVDALEQQGGATLDDEGRPVEGAAQPEDIHDFLEARLTDEEMRYLEALISTLDHGQTDDRDDAYQDMIDAARRRRETQENTMMQAQDEALDLRRQLRASGVPVGPYGDVSTLRRVARAHGLGTRIAMDSGRRLPPHLSFNAMFPGLKRRLDGSRIFAVSTGEAAATARGRSPRMAYDENRVGDDAVASIEAMYGPDFLARMPR
jgi:hypothetical protein